MNFYFFLAGKQIIGGKNCSSSEDKQSFTHDDVSSDPERDNRKVIKRKIQ